MIYMEAVMVLGIIFCLVIIAMIIDIIVAEVKKTETVFGKVYYTVVSTLYDKAYFITHPHSEYHPETDIDESKIEYDENGKIVSVDGIPWQEYKDYVLKI